MELCGKSFLGCVFLQSSLLSQSEIRVYHKVGEKIVPGVKHMRGQTQRNSVKSPQPKRARRDYAAPRTADQYFSRSAQFQDKWNRATHVISKMRADGLSLRHASQEYGIDARTVIRLGGSALRKGTNGRYKAKASDHLLRVMVIPTQKGSREVATRDSREANRIAEYSNAVRDYLQTGDDTALRKLPRKTVTDASGKRIRLMMDLSDLDRLGSAGVLSFESLYAKVG